MRPAHSFMDRGCFVLSLIKNRKFYLTSNFHHPIDMSGASFASFISLQTHTFHFIFSNHGLHIGNTLHVVATFYIFSQVVANLFPICRQSSFANVFPLQGHKNDSKRNILMFIYSYFIVIYIFFILSSSQFFVNAELFI